MSVAVVHKDGGRLAEGTLLDGATGVTNGTWLPLNGKVPAVVTVEGSFTATVQVLVSNSPTKPADSFNDAPQLGADFTGPGSVTTDRPWSWIKARVSAHDSGSINAHVRAGS